MFLTEELAFDCLAVLAQWKFCVKIVTERGNYEPIQKDFVDYREIGICERRDQRCAQNVHCITHIYITWMVYYIVWHTRSPEKFHLRKKYITRD